MEDQSALERHPELAQLWTLHYAGRMALKSLEHRGPVGPPRLVEPVLGELREAIGRLLVAVEQYKAVVELRRTPELLVHIPEAWSAEQADAVMRVLGDLADRVRRVPEMERADRATVRGRAAASASSGRTRPR